MRNIGPISHCFDPRSLIQCIQFSIRALFSPKVSGWKVFIIVWTGEGREAAFIAGLIH
jgi:hypothetical protein